MAATRFLVLRCPQRCNSSPFAHRPVRFAHRRFKEMLLRAKPSSQLLFQHSWLMSQKLRMHVAIYIYIYISPCHNDTQYYMCIYIYGTTLQNNVLRHSYGFMYLHVHIVTSTYLSNYSICLQHIDIDQVLFQPRSLQSPNPLNCHFACTTNFSLAYSLAFVRNLLNRPYFHQIRTRNGIQYVSMSWEMCRSRRSLLACEDRSACASLHLCFSLIESVSPKDFSPPKPNDEFLETKLSAQAKQESRWRGPWTFGLTMLTHTDHNCFTLVTSIKIRAKA